MRLKRDMLLGGQMLIAQHQHFVLDQRRLEGLEGVAAIGSCRSRP